MTYRDRPPLRPTSLVAVAVVCCDWDLFELMG